MRAVSFAAVLLATTVVPLAAHATDVQACLGASEKGQRARSAGRLREARDQFLVCGADGCPTLVRRDCTQWQTEVLAMLPGVVFGAKDKQGRDLFDVTVSMDGETMAKKLDGKAVPVDPGPHTFKFELAGAAAVVERALVKEGEKARALTVTFVDVGGTTASDGTKPAGDGDHGGPDNSERGHTIYPWILVAAGVVTVAVGVVVIVTSPSLPSGCDAATRTCAPSPGESSTQFSDRQNTAGKSDSQPVEGLLIGAVGLAVAAGGLLWHFLEPTGKRVSALQFTPWAGPASAGGTLGASF